MKTFSITQYSKGTTFIKELYRSQSLTLWVKIFLILLASIVATILHHRLGLVIS